MTVTILLRHISKVVSSSILISIKALLIPKQIFADALTPECSTQDLRVEPLLVLANLWRVARRARVDWVDVDH